MTQEEKQLLLADLSARLSCGVIVDIKYNKEHGSSDRLRICSEGSLKLNTDLIGLYIEDEIQLKPYLRPMSSMTDEEWEHLGQISLRTNIYDEKKFNAQSVKGLDIDYLNSIHVDYHGLIPMGLALEAPEDMYK